MSTHRELQKPAERKIASAGMNGQTNDAALRQLLARLLAPAQARGLSSLLGRFGVSPPRRVPKQDGEDHRAAG